MKASWQQAGTAPGNKLRMEGFLHNKKHLTVIWKVKLKLLVEAVFMVLLLLFFYDIFDGDQKPVYANVALVTGTMFYFCSNMLGYFAIRQVAEEQDICHSLKRLLQKLMRAKVFSLTAMLLFSLTLLLFFMSAVALTPQKLFLMAGFQTFVLVQVYLSGNMWNSRIRQIRQLLHELGE